MISIAGVLGGGDFLLGISLVGFLVIIRIAIQTLLDFPTGGLGDWLGQRWIIASAQVCFSLAFLLTAFAVATPRFRLLYFSDTTLVFRHASFEGFRRRGFIPR